MNSARALKNLEDTRKLAAEIALLLKPKSVVLLSGPMGAGKTQLTQFLVEALGGRETASPSFAIHNSYEAAAISVEHFDLFRLVDVDDLESTGFWDVFQESNRIAVIEWSDKLAEFGIDRGLPKDWRRFEIRFSMDNG